MAEILLPSDHYIVKTKLAIVCSLLLVWTQVVLGWTPAAGVERVARAACHCCGKPGCCVAQNSPEPQPPPAAPVSSLSQNQLSLFMAAVPVWTLPAADAYEIAVSTSPFSVTAGAPLYERNCALLL